MIILVSLYLKVWLIIPWSIVSPLANLSTSITSTPDHMPDSTSAKSSCTTGREAIVSPDTTSRYILVIFKFICLLSVRSVFSCLANVSSILTLGLFSSERDFLKYIQYSPFIYLFQYTPTRVRLLSIFFSIHAPV